jgi:hypothetical protein
MVGWAMAVVGRGLRTPPAVAGNGARRCYPLVGLLLLSLLLSARVCLAGAPAGAMRAGAALEVGEMDPGLAEAVKSHTVEGHLGFGRHNPD